jgi:integrase
MSLSELLERDQVWCLHRRQKDTIDLNRFATQALIRWAGDVSLSEVKGELIERFLGHLRETEQLSKTTCNIYLNHLKSVFQRAVSEYNILPEHPFRNVKPQAKGLKNRLLFLSIEQVKILLDSIDDINFKRLVLFYLWTGCRRTEAIELLWNDIDWEGGVLYLGRSESRTKLRRTYPMTERLRQLLNDIRRYRGDGEKANPRVFSMYSDPRAISRRFARLRGKIEGLPDEMSPHTLRHTFASHLVMAGVDLTTIADLMGHTTIQTTELYAHLQPEHKAIAVTRLPY